MANRNIAGNGCAQRKPGCGSYKIQMHWQRRISLRHRSSSRAMQWQGRLMEFEEQERPSDGRKGHRQSSESDRTGRLSCIRQHELRIPSPHWPWMLQKCPYRYCKYMSSRLAVHSCPRTQVRTRDCRLDSRQRLRSVSNPTCRLENTEDNRNHYGGFPNRLRLTLLFDLRRLMRSKQSSGWCYCPPPLAISAHRSRSFFPRSCQAVLRSRPAP